MFRTLFFFFLVASLLGGCSSYLVFKHPFDNRISETNEKAMSGQKLRCEAQKTLSLINHPEVDYYLNQVGQLILSAMEARPLKFRFFVVEDPFVNAFALPCGSIYVNSGLIERLGSTDEVAAVLAHEIVHVKSNHAARLSEPDPLSMLATLPLPSSLFLAPVAVGRRVEKMRQLEQQADTLAIKYIAEAGYDPKRALRALQMIDGIHRNNSSNMPPHLRSHPSPQERIQVTDAAIHLFKQARPRPKASDPIKRVQVNVRLWKEPWDNVIAELEKLASGNPESGEARHLLGIAYHYITRWAEARQSLERARSLNPELPGIERDLGRLYTHVGELRLASEAFERSLKAEPREPLTFLYLGELLEKKGQLDDAALAYRKAHDLSPWWAKPAWHMAVVYGKMNRLGDAYYYLGRSHLLKGDTKNATIVLERALNNFDPESARARAIEDEIGAIKQGY